MLIFDGRDSHADIVSQTPTFSASGNAWAGGGVTNRNFTKDFSLDLTGSASLDLITDWGVLGTYGVKATASTSGAIGVGYNVNFTDPSYLVRNPYTVNFNRPDLYSTAAGQSFSLGMSATPANTQLDTTFLAPEFSSNFFLNNINASVSGDACVYSCVSGSSNLFGPLNSTTTLLGFDNDGVAPPALTAFPSTVFETTLTTFPLNTDIAGLVHVEVNNPNITDSNTANGLVTVNSHNQLFLVQPDVSAMVQTVTGIPLNDGIDFLGVDLSYKTIWGRIGPGIGLDMDSSFNPGGLSTQLSFDKPVGVWSDPLHTSYTLTSSVALNSGDTLPELFFLHPGETVTVTPTHSVTDGSFSNTTSTTFDLDWDLKLLELTFYIPDDPDPPWLDETIGPAYQNSGYTTFASLPIASSSSNVSFGSQSGASFDLASALGACQVAGTVSSGFIFDRLCSGTLTKTTSGTVELFADNTYGGGTILQGGILEIEKDANLGDPGGGITFDGGTLMTRNFDLSTTGITSARAILLNGGGGTFNTNGLDSTLSGIISGAGSFQKQALAT